MTIVEKRQYLRYPSVNLSYVCLDEEKQVVKQSMGRTLNISESGVLLETHFEISELYTIRLTIGIENETVEIEGRVIYSNPLDNGKFGTGIEFSDESAEKQQIWLNYIKSVQERSSKTDADS